MDWIQINMLIKYCKTQQVINNQNHWFGINIMVIVNIVAKHFSQRVQRMFGQDRHKCICISLSHVPTRLQKKTKWKCSKQ